MKLSEHMLGGMDFSKLKVSQVMEYEVESFEPDSGWMDMAALMTRRVFGSVPIVDRDGRLVGIVSEYDLLEVLMTSRDTKTVTAAEIMTEDPVTVTEDTLIGEVIEVLERRHLIRLPVVRDGKLVGLIARRDVLNAYVAATSEPPKWL